MIARVVEGSGLKGRRSPKLYTVEKDGIDVVVNNLARSVLSK
jgi:hypothetical protein